MRARRPTRSCARRIRRCGRSGCRATASTLGAGVTHGADRWRTAISPSCIRWRALIGGPQVRNMGTVGGNLFAAAPLWRLRRRAARAGRAGDASRGRAARGRSRTCCATGRGRALVAAIEVPRPRDARAFGFRKVSRGEAEGRLGHVHRRAACRARAAGCAACASPSARWGRRRCGRRAAERALEGAALDAATIARARRRSRRGARAADRCARHRLVPARGGGRASAAPARTDGGDMAKTPVSFTLNGQDTAAFAEDGAEPARPAAPRRAATCRPSTAAGRAPAAPAP